MAESQHNQSYGRMLSDAQMDGLLTEFFRLEVPVEIQQPNRRPVFSVPATVVPVPRSLRRRFAVVSTVCALAMLLLTVFVSPGGSLGVSDTVSGTSAGRSEGPANEKMMLVSPNAERKSQVVGEDGVTLEETAIELKSVPK